jgi:hypothetical protein
MTIVEIISELIARLPGDIFFATGRPQELNINDATSETLVYLDEPISSEGPVRQYGQVEYNYRIRLYFLERTPDADSTSSQHREIIERMRVLSRQFIIEANAVTDGNGVTVFNPITTQRTDEIYSKFALELTGVLLTVTMTPRQYLEICTELQKQQA